MSAEAVRDLRLRAFWEDAASGPAKQFHAQEKVRIAETAKAERDAAKARKQAATDAADFIARINQDLAAKVTQAAKDRAKAEKDAYASAVKAAREATQLEAQMARSLASEEKGLLKDLVASDRQAARDRANAAA